MELILLKKNRHTIYPALMQQKEHIQLPWMPVYIDKFIAGTTTMSAAEAGAYMLLLLHQWRNGSIPCEPKQLTAISRLKYSALATVLAKFATDTDGSLYNARCRAEYLKQLKGYTGKVERIAAINQRRLQAKYNAEGDNANDIVHDNAHAQVAQNTANTHTTSYTYTQTKSATERRKEKEDTVITVVEEKPSPVDFKIHEGFAEWLLNVDDINATEERNSIFMQVRYAVTPPVLKTFNAHLFTEKKIHKTQHEYIKHLRSWMRTTPEQKTFTINPVQGAGGNGHVATKPKYLV